MESQDLGKASQPAYRAGSPPYKQALSLACLELDKTRKSFLESCFVLNSFITYTKPAKDKTNSFVIYTLRVNIMD